MLFAAAFLTERYFTYKDYGAKDIRRFERVLHHKQQRLDNILDKVEQKLNSGSDLKFVRQQYQKYENLYQKRGIIILLYQDDTLRFWSDNAVPVSDSFSGSPFYKKFVFLGSAWFVVQNRTVGNNRVVGLLLIKHQYPYENHFLKNGFQLDFPDLPESTVVTDHRKAGFQVTGVNSHYLFNIIFTKQVRISKTGLYLSVLFFLAAMILLLFFAGQLIKHAMNSWRLLIIASVAIFLLLVKYVMGEYHLPASLYDLDLFNPRYYATSVLLPSLGDFLILAVFVFFVAWVCYKYYDGSSMLKGRSSIFNFIVTTVIFAFLATFFLLDNVLFQSIILNSSITYETHKAFDISLYSIAGLFATGLLFSGYMLLNDKAISMLKGIIPFRRLLIHFVIQTAIIFAFFYGNTEAVKEGIIPFVFITLLFVIILWVRHIPGYRFHYSTFTLFAALMAVYSAWFIAHYTQIREAENKKVIAINLASEHDPVAELLLNEMNDKIREDDQLSKMLLDRFFTYDEVYNLLKRKYFSGYWDKYELQLTICNSSDSVWIEPDDKWFHCYTFFDDMLDKVGVRLSGSDFYFITNSGGRISYFGKIKYQGKDNTVTLFIGLDSKLITQELGYPELLLDSRQNKQRANSEYSYAKYNKGKLISQSGSFPYSLKLDVYDLPDKEFTSLATGNWNHLFYHVDDENTIVVSNPSVRFFDHLVSFAYLFVFFFFLMNIALFIREPAYFTNSFNPDFRNRIQFSMVSILFLSLILVGSGTIFFSIQQYKSRHNEILSEKIQSVYIELVHKLEYEQKLTSDWRDVTYDNLDELLQKFSNVFYTDINLYDKEGKLLATSRPGVFSKELVGARMNPAAYVELVLKEKAEFIHNERIGSLSYMSAYVPFINSENELLAYLNLPYFTRQNVWSKELSSLVATIVNVYVLLILLSIGIAVLISEKITLPLRMIQLKFSEIELGKKYEKIYYPKNDEIGSLVREYNRMVEELENSIELLAKSERESAWREMAKQIAHEIKNPLTPMRLNVQHLQRAWKDSREDKESYIDRVSKTLIEQIDNLSAIATEFSNFAKMPRAANKEINLLEVIYSTLQLFEHNQNVEIQLVAGNIPEKVEVYADKEQLNRVFVNLVTNGIQSVPENREARITIEVLLRNDNAEVRITDNGRGIPKDLQEKLFQPNFTTKSAGMGLGLAIVKNILINAGGSIDYVTQLHQGTTFIVKLPLLKQV